MEITDIYNKLYNATYCISVVTKPLYFVFIKPLIEKYLADTEKNYYIYVSTDDDLLPFYYATFPNTVGIHYIADGLIPTGIPDNLNVIYIYHHQKAKPSIDEQLELVSHVQSHPLVNYVFIGKVSNLLTSTRVILFRYLVHIEICAGRRWRSISINNIVNYRFGRQYCRKYYAQQTRKKKAVNPMILYDYFILHDNTLAESKIIKFNPIKFIPKKKKKVAKKTIQTTNPTNPINPINPPTVTKINYIYTDRPNTSHLVMPDGSRENYRELVSKYHEVIEI